jgi:hypothetical protein
MNRRPAATLVEVLVSIFIMGIGLLAILALFPLGAIRMAEAIQADRSAQLAQGASALAQALDLRNDPKVTAPSLTPGGGLAAAVAGGPGYPVYIDGIGATNVSGAANLLWVGNNGTPGIRRVAPTIVTTTATAVKWFAQIDDIRFDPTGVPINTGTAAAPALDRETNLSYALMYRRPLKDAPGVTEIAVVVYSRRPISAAANEPEYAGKNVVTFTPANNTITITLAANQPAPPVRAGGWVLDASVQTAPSPTANSYFYRVVSVEKNVGAAAGTFDYVIEVGTPLRNWPNTGTITPRVILMDNVIEVFEKSTGWPE